MAARSLYRKLGWITLLSIPSLLGLSTLYNFYFPHAPCRAAYKRIQNGMTEDQVRATLGGAPGDYRRHKDMYVYADLAENKHNAWTGLQNREWWTDDAIIYVDLGDDGRVIKKRYVKWSADNEPRILDTLLDALGL
jgi:hypothetical protein